MICSKIIKNFLNFMLAGREEIPFYFSRSCSSYQIHRFALLNWCYVLHVEHISCHHKSWPTSVNHPHSFLNICSSLGLAGGNITRKLLFLSLDIFFKILVFQVIFGAIILFVLTFFWLSCYCSMRLYFNPGNWLSFCRYLIN